MSVEFAINSDGYTRTTNLVPVGSFSMCCWVRIKTAGALGVILQFQDLNSTGDLICLENLNNSTQELFNNQGAGFSATGVVMVTGSWYWMGCTVNGNVNTLYYTDVGGTNLTTASFTVSGGTPAVTYDHGWIARDNGTDPFTGDIQSVKIWSAVLSAAEMTNEIFSQRPVRTTNLNAWYPMINATMGVKDFSGLGHNMTAGGTNPTDGPGAPVAWTF